MKKWVLFFPLVIKDLALLLKNHQVRTLASALAFTTLISLVPMLAVSLSVFQTFGGFESVLKKVEPFILHNLVPTSGADITTVMRKSIDRVHSGALGFWGVIGLLLASTKMFVDIERAVQEVWKLTPRKWLSPRLIIYWGVMFVVPVVLAIVLGVLSSKDLGFYKRIPKWTISFGFLFVGLFATYKFMPAIKVVKKWAALSALLAASSIVALQISYVRITKELISYNQVYGSLASVPFFLLWLLAFWWIFLIGSGLCASLQNRSA